MAKSKSRNRKRSSLLKQKKNEKENLNKPLSEGKNKIRQRMSASGMKVAFTDNRSEIKISNVVAEMLQPFLELAVDDADQNNIFGMGIAAWNLGVFKTFHGEKEFKRALKEAKRRLPKSAFEDMMEIVDIKCEDYKQYNQIIYDYEFVRLNNNHRHLTVTYEMR